MFFGFRRMVSTFLCDSWGRSGFPGVGTGCCRVPCVCYDLVRMYVIMYDMIRYVRNTIRCVTCGMCARITRLWSIR